MRRGRLFLFILLAITAVGCAQTEETSNDPIPQKRFSNIDARLHRLLRIHETDPQKMEKSSSLRLSPKGEPVVDLLIQLAPDTLLPQGVTPRTRIGHVVTATATLAGLRALAGQEGIIYVEPSVRLKRRNDIGTSASSGIFNTLLGGFPIFDIYPYDAQANQKITLSMHAALGSALDPYLAICDDQDCNNTPLTFSDGPGPGKDALLSYTPTSTSTLYIRAASPTFNQTGDYILVFHDDARYNQKVCK